MSSSRPTGSGKVRRSAKTAGGRAGDTGSGARPRAWSSRRPTSGPARRARSARGSAATAAMRWRPRAWSVATASGARRSAATGSGPRAAAVSATPGGTIRATGASRVASGGGAPPRSQRRFWARERVAWASWSMASPACATPPAVPAAVPAWRATAQAAPGVSARPRRRVRPRAPASPATRAARGASPPKSRVQPVMSRTRPSGSSATQGVKRPAQRRRAVRKASVRCGSSGRVTRPGQMARASPSAMPRRSPCASAAAARLAITSAPRRSATTTSGRSPRSGSARSTRSASRRGNQSDRMRRRDMGMTRGGDRMQDTTRGNRNVPLTF